MGDPRAVPISAPNSLPLVRRLVEETVIVSPDAPDWAREAGLCDFDAVWAIDEGTPAATHRDRSAVEVRIERGEPRTFFVKRVGRAHVKHMVEAARAMERPVSKCRREWEAARALEEAGVAAAPMVALGERRLGPWPLESFLVVEKLYGSEPLDEFLDSLAALPRRARAREVRALAKAVADAAARMHRAGLFHLDLYAKHIFVRRNGGVFVINIIDLQRMRRGGGLAAAVRDLAALNVTVPLRTATPRTRLRFLAEYARRAGRRGGALRRLARGVVARSLRISRRKKFDGIHWHRRDGR